MTVVQWIIALALAIGLALWLTGRKTEDHVVVYAGSLTMAITIAFAIGLAFEYMIERTNVKEGFAVMLLLAPELIIGTITLLSGRERLTAGRLGLMLLSICLASWGGVVIGTTLF